MCVGSKIVVPNAATVDDIESDVVHFAMQTPQKEQVDLAMLRSRASKSHIITQIITPRGLGVEKWRQQS